MCILHYTFSTWLTAVYIQFHWFWFSSSLTINMAGGDKIKLFQFIQRTYQLFGIYPLQSNQNRSPINWRKFGFLFNLVQFFLSTIAYLLIEANSLNKYGMGFYTSITIAVFSFFWKMENISNYIENCERFIEKSEYEIL